MTLHALISAFQHDHSCRTTLFPDSVMSKDELRTLGWKLWWNIWIFFEITAHKSMVEQLISYWFWRHCMPLFWYSSMIGYAEIHCFLTSKDELSTFGLKMWWNICICLEITGHMCTVEKLTSYGIWWHCMLLFQHSSMITHAEIHCFLTQWCLKMS